VVLDQAIDTSTPSGRFLFNTLGAVAELERDLIRERVFAGIAGAKRRGVRLGRPSALTTEAAQRVARLHGCGQYARAIAKLLGIGKDVVAREIRALASLGGGCLTECRESLPPHTILEAL